MIRVGIDPGLDGAIAGISDGGSVEIADTPTLTIASKRGTKREYDLASMAAILGTWQRTAGISAACIELVHREFSACKPDIFATTYEPVDG